MQILRSKIVPSTVDAYWEPLPDHLQRLPKAKLLVLTYAYERQTQEETTLVRLLQACGYAPGADCEILTLADDEGIAWHSLEDHFMPSYALLLGVNPAILGINAAFAPYAPSKFGKTTFVLAPSLMQLTQDASSKKALWEGALKPLFTVTK